MPYLSFATPPAPPPRPTLPMGCMAAALFHSIVHACLGEQGRVDKARAYGIHTDAPTCPPLQRASPGRESATLENTSY